ncbi:MAG TPA: phosphotransferase [Aliidongia sp.]|nr:phosphotransferase [Aliidongia sp.]
MATEQRRRLGVGPDETLAAASVEAAMGGAIASVTRFETSIRHFVYDVQLTDGRRAVVRLGLPEQREAIAAAAAWSDRLRPMGFPLPAILARDLESAFPFLILERLWGTDLRHAIARLPLPALGQIAGTIAALQTLAARLPSEGRFGYATEAALAPYVRWSDVLAQSLAQSRSAIRHAGLMDESAVDEVERRFARMAPQLDRVPSVPFLPDTTTRNVIVGEDGSFSGLVDIDRLCWGDPRYAPARTAMSLLNEGLPTGYAEAWLVLSGGRADAGFWLYVAICCLGFMADYGPSTAVPGRAFTIRDRDRLDIILERLLSRIDGEPK